MNKEKIFYNITKYVIFFILALVLFLVFTPACKTEKEPVLEEVNDEPEEEALDESEVEEMEEVTDDYNFYKIKKMINNQFKDLYAVHYRKGNFTNSGFDEYLAFFKDIKEAERIKKEPDYGKTIEKLVVYITEEDRVIKYYDLNISTIEYEECELKIIKNSKIDFGKWDGFCYIYDFNENGLDEILFFQLTGMSFEPIIYEFKNNEMQPVLTPPPTYSNAISDIETMTEGENKIIKIWGEGGPDIPSGKRDWYKYKWDSVEKKYTIVEKGFE